MKKQNIIIISIIIVVLIAVGCFFFFKKNKSIEKSNRQMLNQNVEKFTIDSLVVGNWVSVVAEKSNGLYIASMVMACDDEVSCKSDKTNTQNHPSRTAPTDEVQIGTIPTDSQKTRTGNRAMLSGVITEVNTDNIVLSLDTGEEATVLISDTTRIIKR
jgi:hypothetical protein